MINKLNESPDKILKFKDNIVARYSDNDAYAFGYSSGTHELLITHDGTHPDLYTDNRRLFINNDYAWGDFKHIRHEIINPGRLWIDRKLMSFWVYPSIDEMNDLIHDLEKFFKININPKEWKIEVVYEKGSDKKYDTDVVGKVESYIDKHSKIIPLSRYVGSKDSPNMGDEHAKSPMLKKSKSVPTGMGALKRPSGLTQTQMHQKTSTSEGTFIDIKLIIEKLICQPELRQMKEYAKAAIRDVFIQMPTRSIYKKYWESYRNQIASELGEEDTNKAWKELHTEKFVFEDEASGTYMWRRTFGSPNEPAPIKSHTLVEWADNIETQDKKEYKYSDKQAIPFIYNGITGKTYFGVYGGTHTSVYENGEFRLGAEEARSKKLLISGRLWVIDKIISFWQYPETVELFDKIIDSIDKYNKKSIRMDSSWRIDVPEIIKGLISFDYFDSKKNLSNFIKLDDYDPKIIKNPEKYEALMMKEEVLEEDAKHEFGCLMLMLNFPKWKEFIEKMIDKEDVYEKAGEDYGLEYETHTTVLFGFHENTSVDKVKKLVINKEYDRISLLLNKISHFETPEFDVVKFEVESEQLNILHEIMKENFDHTDNYPIYNPHVTIAYVKKGMGQKYDRKLKQLIRLYSNKFKYSYQNGRNIYFNI